MLFRSSHVLVANMLAQIASSFSKLGINIENMSSGSRGEYAYTIVELTVDIPESAVKEIESIDGVIRVRTIR